MKRVMHVGGCHCGRVRFQVEGPQRIQVTDCNCSICAKSGYLHLIVPRSHPDGISVNARALDSGTVKKQTAISFNGADWETHIGNLQALTDQ